MGVPPKVQPMFVSSNLRITELHCSHGCATSVKCSLCLLALPKDPALMGAHLKCSLCLLALPKESLAYTILMDALLKVQAMFVSSNLRITGLHCTQGCAT